MFIELGIKAYIHSLFFSSLFYSFHTRFLVTHLEVASYLFFFIFIFSQYPWVLSSIILAVAAAKMFGIMEGSEKQV